jgi:hypothetical protein
VPGNPDAFFDDHRMRVVVVGTVFPHDAPADGETAGQQHRQTQHSHLHLELRRLIGTSTIGIVDTAGSKT